MSLQNIMSEIKKLKPVAEEEVSEQPRETLGGRMSRQRKAKEDLKGLVESYRQSLLQSAVFILVTGTGRDLFVKTAVEDFKFFSAEADQFYSDIVNSVSPSLYVGKESSPNLLDVVSRILENKALEVGILGYPMMVFRQEHRRLLNTKEDFKNLVKEIVSSQVGTEVVGAQAIKSIVNTALSMEHAGNTTPILLSLDNVDNTLIEGLKRISKKVGVITVDTSDISVSNVKSALAEIRTQMNTTPGLIASFTVNQPETVPVEIEASIEEYAYGAEESVATAPGTLSQEMVEDAVAKAVSRGLAETSSTEPALSAETIEALKPLTNKERKALAKQNKN